MDADRPPPSYNESVPVSGGDAPPSYNELFPMQELKSQMSHAREEGMNPNVPLNICGLFCKSIACGICYLVLAILPISMIVMGSIYLHDCNVQSKIPIFLIVFGCVALAQTVFHLIKMCLCRKQKDDDSGSRGGSDQKSKGGDCCESLITIFLFVWIIVGSYYTFSAWSDWRSDGDSVWCSGLPDDAPTNHVNNCCDAPVMYFAFSALIVMYGMAACCCFCFCCCVCCVTILAGAAN